MTESASSRKQNLSEAKKRLLAERLKGHAGRSKAPEPIPKRPPDEPVRLSPAQHGLWLMQRMEPGSSAYHVIRCFRVDGTIDERRLTDSLRTVTRRQDLLGYRIAHDSEGPHWVIAEDADWPVLFGPTNHQDPVTWLVEAASHPFDLEKAPALRLLIAREPNSEDCWLALVAHHILFDQHALDLCCTEWESIYNGSEPSPSTTSFGDYSHWTHDHLAAGQRDRDLSFWNETLLPATPRALLPFHKQGRLSDRGLWKEAGSLPDTWSSFCQSHAVTPFSAALAAFALLVYRLTGQTDISLGAPVSLRDHPETQHLAGYCLNTIVLRLQVDPDQSVATLMKQAQQAVLAAWPHRHTPFEDVVHSLNPQRDRGSSPLFDYLIVFADAPRDRHFGAVRCRPQHLDLGQSKFDLSLFITSTADGFNLAAEARAEAFEMEDIQTTLQRYAQTARSMLNDPTQAVSRLDILLPEERALLLETWQPDPLDLSSEPMLPEQIIAQAQAHPSALAIQCGEETCSYAELRQRSACLARHLLGQGVQPGALIGLLMPRSVNAIVGLLGILRAGAAYVPLDPAYPETRNQFIIQDAGITTLLTSESLQHTLSGTQSIPIESIPITTASSAQTSRDTLPSTVAAEPCYVIYTSGSTGTPKGVPVLHRNLLSSTTARNRVYADSPSRFLMLSGLSFDSSVAGLFWTLSRGGSLILPTDDEALDPLSLSRLIDHRSVSTLLTIPGLYREILKRAGSFDTLRNVIVAGEACPADLVAEHQARFPRVPFHNEYGPTEATVWATVWEAPPSFSETSVPIGQPIPGSRLYVLDDQANLLPPGIAGTCWIGGAGIVPGYLGRNEDSTTRFVPDPFSQEGQATMYNTGDRVCWRHDGVVQFLGRTDRQIKLRGHRIEPEEIESRLQSLPGIDQACVMLSRTRSGVATEALLAALRNMDPQDAHSLIEDVEGQRSDLTRQVQGDHFQLQLNIDSSFLRTPRAAQRDWILSQALEEMGDDLAYLDGMAPNLVPGSESRLRNEYPDISEATLTDQEILEDWQTPLMKAMAAFVTETHGDVLEIGFGRGVSADFIQQGGVRSHTIIEPNPHSIDHHFANWQKGYPGQDIQLLRGRWQDVTDQLGTYDAIFFHAFPLNEQEFIQHILQSITYAEHAMPILSHYLRPGGAFTYLTTEIDSLSRRHQRLLFQHFGTITSRVVELNVPSNTQDAWWAQTMLVVKAVR